MTLANGGRLASSGAPIRYPRKSILGRRRLQNISTADVSDALIRSRRSPEFHLKLFLAIDNRPASNNTAGIRVALSTTKLVVSVDAHIRVDQFVLISAHDGLRVLTGELQASVFHSFPSRRPNNTLPSRCEFAYETKIEWPLNRSLNWLFFALEFPALEQRVRHGIVMDRNKEICR